MIGLGGWRLAGARVYFQEPHAELHFPLGVYITVFKAVVFAVLAAINSQLQSKGSITIISDNRSALQAVQATETRSPLLLEYGPGSDWEIQ